MGKEIYISFQNPDQKSIKDFFSPSQVGGTTRLDKALMERKEKRKASPLKTKDVSISSDENETNALQPYKKQKFRADKSVSRSLKDTNKLLHDISNKKEETTPFNEQNVDSTPSSKRSIESCLIVLDSASDDDFTDKLQPSSLRKSSKKKSVQKSKKKSSKNVKKSPSTPKCNLVTMFSQSSNESPIGSASKKNKHQNCVTGMDNLDNNSNDVDHREQSIRVIGGSGNQWSCSSCTFLNHNELSHCEICETPKKIKHRLDQTEESSDLSVKILSAHTNSIKSVDSNILSDVVDCRSISKDEENDKSNHRFKVKDSESTKQDETNIIDERTFSVPTDQGIDNEFQNSTHKRNDCVANVKNLNNTPVTPPQVNLGIKVTSSKTYKFKHVKHDVGPKEEDKGNPDAVPSESQNKENSVDCSESQRNSIKNDKCISLEPHTLTVEKKSLHQPGSITDLGMEDTGKGMEHVL